MQEEERSVVKKPTNVTSIFEVIMLTMDSTQHETFDVVMLALNARNQDKAWYLDSGASKHVTCAPNGIDKLTRIGSTSI